MLNITNLKLPVELPEEELKAVIARELGVPKESILSYRILRCSLDARKKDNIFFLYTVEAELQERAERSVLFRKNPNVTLAKREDPSPVVHGSERLTRPVAVVGMGPAGMFAAYHLAINGYRPILIERGKRVSERTSDVEEFWKTGNLNPKSNVMFGEGGAGTFSDGKLTTRIKDPLAKHVVETLVQFGAPPSIAYKSKPHVGTDYLRTVMETMRNAIIAHGGDVRFETKLIDITSKDGDISSITLECGGRVYEQPVSACVLAIGQGARDTYRLLFDRGIELLPKPFAVGVRIEHPQRLIDQAQFGRYAGHPRLGAAEYALTAKGEDRGVYTFCMCPGGFVIASSSDEGEVVTNGMSNFDRSEQNANSAVVVAVGPEDFGSAPLAGVEFQEELEKRAFVAGGSNYFAPAQRLEDFIKKRPTKQFGAVVPTYRPGVKPSNLWDCLPEFVAEGIQRGIRSFARQLKGFDHPDAVLTAVESRTSAPVRIVRDETGCATRMKGLYPAGEGAGYAGGIVSAAVDGLKAAQKIMGRYRPMG